MKRFIVYMARWQLSSIVLAPCIALIPHSAVLSAVVANTIGAIVFWWVDKLIFSERK